MCKGSQSTTTQTTAPNPQAGAAYSNILNRAQGVSETPWQNYGGEFVAPVNPQQYTGIGNVNQYAFAAQPALGVAQNMAWNAAQPISYADIARYQNPWTQNVVGATEAQFNNQNLRQLQNVRGNAIAQGAFGGDREAVAEAELANQQNLAQAPVIANLMSQGYTQGVNTALTEQQALASGAYSLGNLGVAGQTAGLTGAGAQIQAGGLEQTTQQAADTAAYNQWLASRAYPFQTTQWLAGLDTGIGSQMGGTSATQAPTPSPWSQVAGLGLGGLGIMGETGAFGAGGWFPAMFSGAGGAGAAGTAAEIGAMALVNRGGRINGVAGYEDGGGVSPLPYASPGHAWEPYAGGRGWVPAAAFTHGQGAPAPPRPPQQDSDPMKLGEQVAGLAKYFKDGKTPTGFPSGGTSPGWLTSDSPIMSGYSGVAPVAPPLPPSLPPGTGWAGAGSPLMAGYRRDGGGVLGYADGGMPDDIDLPAMPYRPSLGRTVGEAVAPGRGLYDYFTAERPPPDIMPNVAGKVPSATHDPYAEGAVRDVAGLGMAAIPFGRAAGLAARAGEIGSERLGLGAIGDVSGSLPTAGLGARTGMAAGIAATLPGGPAEAADAALGPRPGITPDEQAQIDRLNKEISGLTAQRAKVTDPNKVGPKGAAIQGAPFDAQIEQRNASIRTIMGQVAGRQQAYDERAEEFAKKTGPFATREPEWNAALTAAPAASAASGAILGGLAGRKISPMKRVATYGAAGLGGGLEGLIGGYYPTYADLHMPEGSVAKTQAEARESDPRFWEHGVAPEIGMSAATGLLGAKYGMLRREAKPVAAAAEAAISPSRYPDIKDAAAVRRYQAGLKQDSAGRWYEPGKGMVAKDYWPPAKPSGKVVPIQAAEAHGGAVRGYADGGSPIDYGDFGSTGYTSLPWPGASGTGLPPVPSAPPSGVAPINMPLQRGVPTDASIPSSFASRVQALEGFQPKAVWDYHQWTNGYGTRAAYPGEVIDHDTAVRRFNTEMSRASSVVDRVNPNLDPGTRSALASLTFNAGDSWLNGSLGRAVRTGDLGAIRGMMSQYTHAGGQYLPGLASRRAEEESWLGQDAPPSGNTRGIPPGGHGDLVPLSTGVAPQSGIDLSSNSKLWPSLMAAGFGMMASRSPYPLQAIGEGALTGMGAYTKATELESERALKQSDIQLRAERLWEQNETERRKLAETSRHNVQMETKIGVPPGFRTGEGGLEPIPGGPHDPNVIARSKIPPGYRYKDDGTLERIPGGPTDPNVVAETAAAKRPPLPGMTPEQREIQETQIAHGNMSPLVGLPRTPEGLGLRNGLRNGAAQRIMNEHPEMSPAQVADYLNDQEQNYKAKQIGLNAGARTNGTRLENLNIILDTANAAIPAALEASQKVARTGIVPLNRILQKGEINFPAISGEKNAGDLVEFGMANLQLAEHWARAMNPTGVMRESDRDKALTFLDTALSGGTYERAVLQLQKQITRERDAVRKSSPNAPINPNARTPEPGAGEEAITTTDPLAEARAAIARNAPRDKVIERLRQQGIDPSGL